MPLLALPVLATLLGAGATVGSTAYGIFSGQKQAAVQKKTLQNQEAAQKTAETNMLDQQRRSDMNMNAANQKTPDIAAILQRAADSSKGGIGSTMLTGASGVNPGGLSLGKSSLLGG